MNKKLLFAIIFLLLIICCGIPVGLWIYSAANTKPVCQVVNYTGENKLSTYLLTLSPADSVDINFEINSLQGVFMAKSTELFGTGKDYKCPENLTELKINTTKATQSGKSFGIIYKKTGDYTANIGISIDGKEYYQ